MRVEAQLPSQTVVTVRGEDAEALSHLVVAGFFSLWLLDSLDDPAYARAFQAGQAPLKAAVPKEAALRVLRAFSRAHPNAEALLRTVDSAGNLPW